MRSRRRKTSDLNMAAERQETARADEALAEARSAFGEVQKLNKRGFLIAETIRNIRRENHFSDIWYQGMGG